MFELFLVYCWLKIEAIHYLVGVSAFIFVLFGMWKYVYYFSTYLSAKMTSSSDTERDQKAAKEFLENPESYYQKYTKWGSTFIVVGIITIGLSNLMPTQKELSILIATGYTVKAIKSPEVQKMVALAKGMANDWMDAELKNRGK